jgi:hypothetical protein
MGTEPRVERPNLRTPQKYPTPGNSGLDAPELSVVDFLSSIAGTPLVTKTTNRELYLQFELMENTSTMKQIRQKHKCILRGTAMFNWQ